MGAQIFRGCHEDEARAIGFLRKSGSEARRIFRLLRLSREIAERALAEMSGGRSAHVALCSVLCATRYKFFGTAAQGFFRPSLCFLCANDRMGTFDHMVELVGMRSVPKHDEFFAGYLVEPD